jgi:hypothetical protein
MKRTEYKYIVELSRYNKQERTIYIDDNNNYVYKYKDRYLEVYDYEYNRVNIPIDKMTRSMLNEYTKSLIKNCKNSWIAQREEQHKVNEYRKFINMFVAKDSLHYLDKLDEKLDEYKVNIELFDDQKLESVG